jgi:hypothetical protein
VHLVYESARPNNGMHPTANQRGSHARDLAVIMSRRGG